MAGDVCERRGGITHGIPHFRYTRRGRSHQRSRRGVTLRAYARQHMASLRTGDDGDMAQDGINVSRVEHHGKTAREQGVVDGVLWQVSLRAQQLYACVPFSLQVRHALSVFLFLLMLGSSSAPLHTASGLFLHPLFSALHLLLNIWRVKSYLAVCQLSAVCT